MKISSKRLPSGKFQVKFDTGGYYGYLLAEPGTKVSEVIAKISDHLRAMQHRERYFQRTLYSVGAYAPQSHRILLFDQQCTSSTQETWNQN